MRLKIVILLFQLYLNEVEVMLAQNYEVVLIFVPHQWNILRLVFDQFAQTDHHRLRQLLLHY